MYTSEKTDPGMLPQSLALEIRSADTVRGNHETGFDAARAETGVQHGRGETSRETGVTSSRKTKPSCTVAVLDRHGKPLMPCTPKRARKLLESGRARVHRVKPFVIRIVDRTVNGSVLQPVAIGIDPGSKHTGIAVFSEVDQSRTGLLLIQLDHRGFTISNNLKSRAGLRRGRRSRNLRYRKPRFDNRTGGYRQKLAPSLRHRVETTNTWVTKLIKWFPVKRVLVEQVKFDMAQIQNPEISGVEYQQGTLQGYTVREYLLEKFGRKCVYCDAENTPLNVDHVRPRSLGGTDRVSNLVLACVTCNQKKSNKPLEEFAPLRAKTILAKTKRSLVDAAAVNATRNEIVRTINQHGLPLELSNGAQTKLNRKTFNIQKTHALDALCVGQIGGIVGYPSQELIIKSCGRGTYARTRSDAYGFPRLRLPRTKGIFGFQTGDLIKANVPKGKHAGVHTGRVAVRSTDNFDIKTSQGELVSTNHRNCQIVQRSDGYSYSTTKVHSGLTTRVGSASPY